MYLPPRIDCISLGLTYCRSSYELDRNQYLLPEEISLICKNEVDGPTPTEYTSTPLSLRERRTLFLYASESLSSFHGPPDITIRIYVNIIAVSVRAKVLTPKVDGIGQIKEWGTCTLLIYWETLFEALSNSLSDTAAVFNIHFEQALLSRLPKKRLLNGNRI